MYKILLRSKAQKELEKIPSQYRRRIQKAINGLRENPLVGKKLQGEFEGYRTLVIKPYRVLYFVEKKNVTIYVIHIGHRQGVYG